MLGHKLDSSQATTSHKYYQQDQYLQLEQLYVINLLNNYNQVLLRKKAAYNIIGITQTIWAGAHTADYQTCSVYS